MENLKQKTQEELNCELAESIKSFWKVAKVEPLRDDKNARVVCVLLNNMEPIAQMDFTAPLDKLHEVFSFNHENLRKFIQEFI